ncbi:MAG: SurA N-terminal domain-containing protein [Rikenellaceae bacterium]|jgi:peptidyl-prolyl cis-trans isomerase D|nr:SurA N-terminal domain-containing protein [Rikenellaceae bacterium]
MATLNTLRTKGGLIVSIVIGVSLMAFLLGDLAGQNSIFNPKMNVGEINGQKVGHQDYAREIDYLGLVNKTMTGSESTSTEQQGQLRAAAWEKMINERVFFPGCEALGITVSEAEMLDLVYGDNISPILLNAGFFNSSETGLYDKTMVRQFVDNINMDPTGNLRMVWDYIQEQVRTHAVMTKYGALARNMVYVTDFEVQEGVANTNQYYKAKYVAQSYSSIPDSTVTVSNADLQKYHDAHKNLYRQVASRDIEYVMFDVVPSAEDYENAAKTVNELAAEFAVAENPQQYVTINSQGQFNPYYFSQEELSQIDPELAVYAFSADAAKEMYGPVMKDDNYLIARFNNSRMMSDTVAIRQIILTPDQGALADSLIDVVKQGGKFADLAARYSINNTNGGDLGRTAMNQVPAEIADRIATQKGEIIKLENTGGIALLDVYYRGPETRKVQLAMINHTIEPSSTTQQAIYARASKFVTAVTGSYDKFGQTVADSAYDKRVARILSTDSRVAGFENAREMVLWAYNNEPGKISSILEIDNNYVVAALVSERKDGFATLKQATNEIIPAVRNEKKAEMLAAKMTGASSIDELSQQLGAPVSEIAELNFNTYFIPEIGIDPVVVGAVCGMTEGKVSKPVKGMTGVYVLEITGKETREDVSVEGQRVRQQAMDQNYADQRAMQAVFGLANIKDGRAKYF